MSEHHDLSLDEHAVLLSALERPITDTAPLVLRVCLSLAARGLMQRAGGVGIVNGWHGSPHAFVLTREGWSTITARRRRAPVRRTA